MYIYLHTNGSLITKVDFVVDSLGPSDYFESDFVEEWWHFKTKEDFKALIPEFDRHEVDPEEYKFILDKM